MAPRFSLIIVPVLFGVHSGLEGQLDISNKVLKICGAGLYQEVIGDVVENIHFTFDCSYLEESHISSSQIRRSWNPAPGNDSRNRREADLSGYPGLERLRHSFRGLG